LSIIIKSIYKIKFDCDINEIRNELDSQADISCIKLTNPTLCSGILNRSMNTDDSLCVATVNIRSVNRNLDRFLIFLSQLGMDIDIIVLTECWLSDGALIPLLDNYYSFNTTHNINQNDGVIAYVKNTLSVTGYEPIKEDGNFLVLEIENKVSVICTYRPPCYHNPTNYINSIHEILCKIKCNTIILTGDVNLDIMPENITGYSAEYMNMLAYHGLRQCINIETRNKSCLDHFMVKCKKTPQSIVFEEFTDHCPIMLYIKNTKVRKTSSSLIKHKLNYDNIIETLKSKNWQDFYSADDVDIATAIFVQDLQDIIKNHTITTVTSKRYRPLKPWITPGVVRSIKKRNKLHQKAKRSPLNVDLATLYREYRNTCNKLIKMLKKQYYQREFVKNKGNIKETWKLIKEIGNLTQCRSQSSDLIRINNTPLESLNFTRVGSDLARITLQKLDKTESDLAKLAAKSGPSSSMSLFLTNSDEIRTIIQSLKSNSSPGWDNISSLFFKTCSKYLSEPIARLCNLSFESGKFPNILKQALVVPIHKSGDSLSATNYRPISLLSTLTKVVEKLANKRLVHYLESNKYLANNQFEFRANKSTEDAVLLLTSKISYHLDKGRKCAGVFLDLQKAFDSVSISVLLSRLHNVGIRGVPHSWFSDYLTDRSQKVRINKHVSNSASCSFGVPQGSILGPSLFIIYVNELCNMKMTNADIIMFADDTVILFHGHDWESVQQHAQAGLCEVTRWLEDSLLTINASKTKFVCFYKTAHSEPPQSISITIHTHPCNRNDSITPGCNCPTLEKCSNIRYLGVFIDSKLSWSKHISILTTRLRRFVFVFKNLRTVLDIELLIQIYNALCHCLINYCICSWGAAGKSYLIEAERAQRALLKVILSLPFRFPTDDLYKKAEVLSVRKTYILQCLRRYHKTTVPPAHNKRVKRCLLPMARCALARRQFDYQAPILYNKLTKFAKIHEANNYSFRSVALNWLKDCDYGDCEALLHL
jgi:hypothetical protein